MILKSELVSFYSHLAATAASVVGTIFLIYLTSNSHKLQFLSSIYGFSVSFLFLTSSLYHANKQSNDGESLWRKLDHTAIFFMIAGTYTPVCYLYLPKTWFIVIVSAQWALVVFGFFFKFSYLHAPRIAYTLIYLAMGWMAVIPIKQLFISMPFSQFLLVLSGGIAFSIGAVFYAFKSPVIKKDFFGFHEIFHFMIIIGAGLHYVLIYRGLAFLQKSL